MWMLSAVSVFPRCVHIDWLVSFVIEHDVATNLDVNIRLDEGKHNFLEHVINDGLPKQNKKSRFVAINAVVSLFKTLR